VGAATALLSPAVKHASSATFDGASVGPLAEGAGAALASSVEDQARAAQTAGRVEQGAAPDVDAILDRYVKALGGKEALENVTSQVGTGTFEAPEAGLSGPTEQYSKAPNRFFQKLTITGLGVVQQGYDGKVGWSQDPVTGLRELQGAELAQTLRLSDIHRDIKLKQLYQTLRAAGKEKVGDSDAYVIEAVPPAAKPEKLYFDVSTGLLVRQDVVTISPQGEVPAQTYFEDYRDVGGVKIPFTVRQVAGSITFITKLTEVKVNVPVDDSKFAKPAAQ
jgi:zinc protease